MRLVFELAHLFPENGDGSESDFKKYFDVASGDR